MMNQALITLAYLHIIDEHSNSSFEKNIFNASYNEFILKSQAYNMEKKFRTFREMATNDGRVNSLHYKLSFPVLPYIDLLQKKIPRLLDNAGNNILFDTWKFELIDSDTRNKSAHKVAVTYCTGTITLIETLGAYMLLAMGNKRESLIDMEDCFVLKMQDNLSITTFQQLPEQVPV